MDEDELENQEEVCRALRAIADAITPADTAGRLDATGGFVSSLTEAGMGIAAGLVRVANALESVADAIRELRTNGK